MVRIRDVALCSAIGVVVCATAGCAQEHRTTPDGFAGECVVTRDGVPLRSAAVDYRPPRTAGPDAGATVTWTWAGPPPDGSTLRVVLSSADGTVEHVEELSAPEGTSLEVPVGDVAALGPDWKFAVDVRGADGEDLGSCGSGVGAWVELD